MSKHNRDRRRALKDRWARRVGEVVSRMLRPREDVVCLLCGGPATFRGLFFPNPAMSRRLLVPTGKGHVYGYGLCGSCRSAPGATARVEAAIVADFERGAAGVFTN